MTASVMNPRPMYANANGPAAINIIDVLRGMARRKLFVLGMGLVAFGLGFGLIKVLKPVYSTEAQVLIQNNETPFDRVQPLETQRGNTVDDRVVASQMSVIKSVDLGRRVVAALGLDNKPEFNPMLRGVGSVGKLKIALGFGTDPRLKTPEQRALDHYNDELSVFQLPDSNVIGIKYTSVDPDTAAKIANTLAETYVMWTRESQSQPTERAREWLSQQISTLRDKLAQTEAAVEEFRAQAGLLQGTANTLGIQEISELNSQITVARSASLEARAKADAIRDMFSSRGSVETASDVLASAAVQKLKEQRTDATRRMAELSVTYLSNHPKMIAVRNEISNIDQQIRAEALKVVASLDEQARVAEARQNSLELALVSLKAQERNANLDDVKLKALERDAAADRALLESLLSRYAEASARQELSAQPGLGIVIQNAAVPSSPSFPKSGPMVLLITIAGLSLGLGLAFLMELMAAGSRIAGAPEDAGRPNTEPQLVRVERSEVAEAPAPEMPPAKSLDAKIADVKSLEGTRPTPIAVATKSELAVSKPRTVEMPQPTADAIVTPILDDQRRSVPAAMQHLTLWPKIVPQDDLSAITDGADVANAAKVMAGWVSDNRRDLEIRRVGLTSLGGGAADSPVAALTLARALSRGGKRIVLVDLARMGSFLGGLCGVPEGPGLSDLVTGTAPFTKIIARDERSGVHVLRFGNDHSPRAAGLILEHIQGVLGALIKTYDLAIVNLGEADGDTPVYLHHCEAAIVLASAPRLMDATQAIQTLLDTGLAAAQLVLIGQSSSALGINSPVKAEAVNG